MCDTWVDECDDRIRRRTISPAPARYDTASVPETGRQTRKGDKGGEQAGSLLPTVGGVSESSRSLLVDGILALKISACNKAKLWMKEW